MRHRAVKCRVSTPTGVLSDAEARAANVGGEVLAEVF
jgi:small subunit ribosomal protein S8